MNLKQEFAFLTGCADINCENLKQHIMHDLDDHIKVVEYLYLANNKLFGGFLNNKDDKFDLGFVSALVKSIILIMRHEKNMLNDLMPMFKTEYSLANHSLHVALYSIKLGTLVGLDDSKLFELGIAALLHDLGQKHVSEKILFKNDNLNEDEMNQVHAHPRYSVEIVEHNNITNSAILEAILHHHERYDGSGYPGKLTKIYLSSFASILAICDVFDAMTCKRPYRREYKSFEALKNMIQSSSVAEKFNKEYLNLSLKSLIG